MKIVALDVVDWRYPTSLNSDGSDAVHKDPDYSCVYVTLRTDGALDGYGLTFTLGRGNEVVATCCESLAPLVVGLDLETDVLGDLVAFQRRLTQDGQLRWIGPEKGALAMACGAAWIMGIMPDSTSCETESSKCRNSTSPGQSSKL